MRACWTEDGVAFSIYRLLVILGMGRAEGHLYIAFHVAWTVA